MDLYANHESRHYMIVPAPKFAPSPSNNNFSVSLSGIAVLKEGLRGGSSGVLHLSIDDMFIDHLLTRVNNNSPLPPPSAGLHYRFVSTQGVINASIAQFDVGASAANSGFNITKFEIALGDGKTNTPGHPFVKVTDGMNIYLETHGTSSRIYKVAYSMELYGYFATVYLPIID